MPQREPPSLAELLDRAAAAADRFGAPERRLLATLLDDVERVHAHRSTLPPVRAPSSPWLHLHRVAEAAGVSRERVAAARRSGQLQPSERVGGSTLIPADVWASWLADHRRVRKRGCGKKVCRYPQVP